jgi:Alpha-L-fucosidase
MKSTVALVLILFLALVGTASAENIVFPADAWRALRVGLFIHWGPSSGKALLQSHSHARKSALNPHGSVPAEVYDQFYKEFNPTNHHADVWLKLAHDAGMRYAVFVAKHHDGFCMFKTTATDYNIMARPTAKTWRRCSPRPASARALRSAGRSRPRIGSTPTSTPRTTTATTRITKS